MPSCILQHERSMHHDHKHNLSTDSTTGSNWTSVELHTICDVDDFSQYSVVHDILQ